MVLFLKEEIMAKFRYIYTDFWNDQKVIERFTPEDKLFMLYLLTNKYTKQIGVYRIPLKVIAFEIGYSTESINSMIERFMNQYKLIAYDEETSEIAIKNWGKYNLNKGGTPVECCIKAELEEVKNKNLLLYVYDGIKNEKLKEIFKEHIDKFKDINKDVNNDCCHNVNYDTHNETCYDTNEDTPKHYYEKASEKNKQPSIAISTIRTRTRGENENKKENKNEKENGNYIVGKINSDETSESESKNDTSKVTYDEIIDYYNSICKSLPKVKARSKTRDKTIKAFYIKLKSIEKIKELFSKVEASDFLTGRDGKWGNCGFDWIIKEANYIKILEGNYANKSNYRNSNKVKLRFDNFSGRNYDYDSLEKKLLGWD
jgi:hypothetical protein